MRSIYKFYKERLIEISGRNRSLYSKKISKKFSYDIGKLLLSDDAEIKSFLDCMWKGKRTGYTLLSKSMKDRLYQNLNVEQKVLAGYKDTINMSVEEKRNENLRRERLKRDENKKALLSEVNALKTLKREIEEFAKETGRYEMFVGYPFVTGAISKDMVVRAPLVLFPVIIDIVDESTVELRLKHDESIQLNKVFILAYAKQHKINVDDLNMEFDNLSDYGLRSEADVLQYLAKFDIQLQPSKHKGMVAFDKSREPSNDSELKIENLCVVGRFPLANAIYNDYSQLDKHKLSSEALDELLEAKKTKKIKKSNTDLYTINSLDYAQENAITGLNVNGNMVIYGPPGTGKSQTIVNIISDALCKHKRVLVVSQKKAALDVVFNRLGILNNKAMFLTDAEKNKVDFYERVKLAHQDLVNGYQNVGNTDKYVAVQKMLFQETQVLEDISKVLFEKTSFGLSLQEMYASSYMIGKDSRDYAIYQKLLKDKVIMRMDYETLYETIRVIQDKNIAEYYYKFLEVKKNNPLVDHVQPNLDVHIIGKARAFLEKLISTRIVPFDSARIPNARQYIAGYLENGDKLNRPLIKYTTEMSNPKLYKTLRMSYVLFPLYPIFKYLTMKKEKESKQAYEKTIALVQEYVQEYSLLQLVLDEKGYSMTLDNILNGNTMFLKLLLSVLDNYVDFRDLNTTLESLDENQKRILNFAYVNSNSLLSFKDLIQKVMIIRIYHEVLLSEEKHRETLSKIMNYDSTKNRIISLKEELRSLAKNICLDAFKDDYISQYQTDPDHKNFLYQITKQQSLWPIRRLMEEYGSLLLNLFPCWLLSPESVSTIMPLKRNLFDIILFDEASQVFIESTLPTIYRGKYIVVAGDAKQLRPTATFMKRYMGNDDDSLDLNTQAALEVESLLDLATSRYHSTNLTYHYRSKSEELINFSNYAFYDGRLQIAPNITKNVGQKPIERVKVNGQWLNRKNTAEAKAVVELLKKIFKTRKANQSIGIITFNTEQEDCIEDAIDAERAKDADFHHKMLKEQNRKENGEDTSIFIKNLENVQGDERDIIIFSIGYARNEFGKVMAHFGPLSIEGGENRLNVAITRAKEKIYVVTSIEPEELQVEGTKNIGPKLFKSYLRYVRAVSSGNQKEVTYILENLKNMVEVKPDLKCGHMELEMKEELEKLGYRVETNLGNANYKLSLAVYDKKNDQYKLGIECDYAAYQSSDSILERDVFRPKFLETRGWKILRVWSRDWWINRKRVLSTIENLVGTPEISSTGKKKQNLPIDNKAKKTVRKTDEKSTQKVKQDKLKVTQTKQATSITTSKQKKPQLQTTKKENAGKSSSTNKKSTNLLSKDIKKEKTSKTNVKKSAINKSATPKTTQSRNKTTKK